MARYRATVETDRPPGEVFAYLSDFSTIAGWDPGVATARRLDDGPVRLGSRFEVTTQYARLRSSLVYEIVEHEPPHAVTLRGENATVVSLDRIMFAEVASGTSVTYDAQLIPKGPLKLAEPLFRLFFRVAGNRARDGLRRSLAAPQPPAQRRKVAISGPEAHAGRT